MVGGFWDSRQASGLVGSGWVGSGLLGSGCAGGWEVIGLGFFMQVASGQAGRWILGGWLAEWILVGSSWAASQVVRWRERVRDRRVMYGWMER